MACRRSARRRSRRRRPSGYRSYSSRRSRGGSSFGRTLAILVVVLGVLGTGIWLFASGTFSLSMSSGGKSADRGRLVGTDDMTIPTSDLSNYWWLATEVEEVSTSEIPGTEGLPGSGSGGEQVVQRVVLPVGITFRADSAELSEDARRSLESVVAEIDPSTAGITVLCHSSSDGKPESRQEISEARANALASLLEDMIGWETGTIVRKGLGDAFPLAGVDPMSPTGRLMNRRCEILLEL